MFAAAWDVRTRTLGLLFLAWHLGSSRGHFSICHRQFRTLITKLPFRITKNKIRRRMGGESVKVRPRFSWTRHWTTNKIRANIMGYRVSQRPIPSNDSQKTFTTLSLSEAAYVNIPLPSRLAYISFLEVTFFVFHWTKITVIIKINRMIYIF